MPLATTTVNGTITLPDGGGISTAIIAFSLVRFQTVSPYVIPTANKTANIAANGDFTVELAQNDPAQAPTYLVTLTVYNSSGAQVHFEKLGYIAVPAIGPVELADLIVLDPPESTQADALAQALAAASAAAGQAILAQGYADDASGFADDAANSAIDASGFADDAANSASLAASYTTPYLDDVDAVLADTSMAYGVGAGDVAAGDYIRTRAEGAAYEVADAGAVDHHITTAGGVKLYVSDGNSIVTPRMFGAAGDGVADDLIPLQASWDFGAAHKIPVHMGGLEYNCSDTVFTSSDLTVFAQGAVMYVTAWPAVGGFINNVRPLAADRVQSNIRIHDLVTDGSKLPPGDGTTQNTNLGPEFARGASNVRIVNCTARKCPEGYGGGTGGGGFGGEQGLSDVQFIGCVAEDCLRGARVAGVPGEHEPGVGREAIGVVFRDFTARRCGCAVFCHSVGHTGDDQSDLSIFDALFDGLYIEDCGHSPWRTINYAAYPSISPQKTGPIVLGGAQNVRFRAVRIKTSSGFPDTFTDWLGRTGYPAAASGTIGEGLSGDIGALVWGWGQNVVFEDVTFDGSVDVFWQCARAVAFGDLSSFAPTYSDGTVRQVVFESVRHVRPGAYGYVFDGQTGLDNARMSARMVVTPSSNPATGVVGPNGTSGLSSVQIGFVSNTGKTELGTIVDWLAAGNARPSGAQDVHFKGGYDVGGGYSATGTRRGQSYDPSAGFLRSSQSVTSAAYHHAFYNPNGLVGGIRTSASATEYLTSSDARLKDDFRDFDGLSLIMGLPVYDHAWRAGGRAFGVIAQEAVDVLPHAVSVGDSDADWAAIDIGDRQPWSVDYSKIVPVLIRAVQQLASRLEDEQ